MSRFIFGNIVKLSLLLQLDQFSLDVRFVDQLRWLSRSALIRVLRY
jgi:hypothetical protein